MTTDRANSCTVHSIFWMTELAHVMTYSSIFHHLVLVILELAHVVTSVFGSYLIGLVV